MENNGGVALLQAIIFVLVASMLAAGLLALSFSSSFYTKNYITNNRKNSYLAEAAMAQIFSQYPGGILPSSGSLIVVVDGVGKNVSWDYDLTTQRLTISSNN